MLALRSFPGLFIICIGSGQARAADIFGYQGPYSKAQGGAGIIMSRSGEAVLHNPANLWSSQSSDVYLDVSPSRLTYKVTTPDPNAKGGAITVPVAPLTSFGGSVQNRGEALSLGYVFVPTGAGSKVEVKGFPVQVNGAYQLADVTSKQSGFKTGLGLAYRFNSKIFAGLSLLGDYAKNETSINISGEEYLNISSRSEGVRFGFGVRYLWEETASFAFTFQRSSEIHYTLDVSAFSAPPDTFYRRNYKPSVFGAGLVLEPMNGFQPFAQYFYERWTPATFIAKSPTQALAGDMPVEFLNTHNYVLGTKYRLGSSQSLSTSYSFFSKNKGPGIAGPNGQILMQGRSGQDFEALDRYHVTTAYDRHSRSSDLMLYGSYIRGTATNPPEAPSAGFYELTIIMVGVGYVWKDASKTQLATK